MRTLAWYDPVGTWSDAQPKRHTTRVSSAFCSFHTDHHHLLAALSVLSHMISKLRTEYKVLRSAHRFVSQSFISTTPANSNLLSKMVETSPVISPSISMGSSRSPSLNMLERRLSTSSISSLTEMITNVASSSSILLSEEPAEVVKEEELRHVPMKLDAR